MEKKYDFGLIGLGVMGRNFILNVADHGFSAFGNDLDDKKVKALIEGRRRYHQGKCLDQYQNFCTGPQTTP